MSDMVMTGVVAPPGSREASECALAAVLRALEARGALGGGVPHAAEAPAALCSVDARQDAADAAPLPLPTNVGIRFVVDEETGEVSAWVLDRDTGEVLRTVPPEALLRAITRTGRLTGLFVEALS